MAKTQYPVVLIDVDSISLSQAVVLLGDVRRLAPRAELIVLLDEPNFDAAVQLVRRGAVDVVCRSSDDLRLLGRGWRRPCAMPNSERIAVRCCATTAS